MEVKSLPTSILSALVNLICAALIIILCSAKPVFAQTEQSCRLIGIFAQQIGASRDEIARSDLATDLAEYVNENPDCGKAALALEEITALLKDRNDGVRWYAAQALAYIGPPARSSVPALEQALKESDVQLSQHSSPSDPEWSPMLPTMYSGQAIRRALRAITGETVPEYGDPPVTERHK